MGKKGRGGRGRLFLLWEFSSLVHGFHHQQKGRIKGRGDAMPCQRDLTETKSSFLTHSLKTHSIQQQAKQLKSDSSKSRLLLMAELFSVLILPWYLKYNASPYNKPLALLALRDSLCLSYDLVSSRPQTNVNQPTSTTTCINALILYVLCICAQC